MNVYLKRDGQDMLPGDLILRWVLRSDLAPVPRTVEMTLQVKDGLEQKLAEGASFWTGREMLEYRVVKSKREKPSAVVQGKDQLASFTVTALLASCVGVSYRLPRAVISENTSLGALYRACGANATIAADFPVPRFACFAGEVPSIHLAKAMQEEGAVLVYRGGQLVISRITDLFRQTPVDSIGQTDSTGVVLSEFLQRHEIPAFYSLNVAGGFVKGAFEKARAIQYMPRSDERTLRNASRVLVNKRVVDSQLCEQVNAGDVFAVMGEKLVVITAAHVIDRAEGVAESNSKLWLGVLSQ